MFTHSIIIPEGDEVYADFEFVFDGGDLVVDDLVLGLDENLFGEEKLVREWALVICGASLKGRQHSISKSAVVSVLDFDDCLLLGEEGGERAELETRERDVLRHLEICLQDLIQYLAREIAVEQDVPISNDVDEAIQLTVMHNGTLDDSLPTVQEDRIQVAKLLFGWG